MPQIHWVGMTRQHYQPGKADRIRMVVIHATAGRAPSDLAWLRRGGEEGRPVSAHYYIDKSGRISQLVRDADIAWHAGKSRWVVDGKAVDGCNAVSIGIELENLNNGRDPYPGAQYTAVVELTRELVRRYNVPRSQLVRHVDIAPGRKIDPAGFPWLRFVADVYAEQPGASERPAEQLWELMLDAAYRAAGGALLSEWPLLAAARAADLGMPVAAVSGRPRADPPVSSQDDHDRVVRLPGLAPMIVEVYARDLLFAPVSGADDEPPAPSQARRLATVPPGPLRDALLSLMFQAADPVNGFQPDWAFHRRYLADPASLGAPIGPSHRIAVRSLGTFSCQHFALDTLCSPVGAWQTVYRLSELGPKAPGLQGRGGELRRVLLDDLYRARSGHRYDPTALLTGHAEEAGCGAPLGRPEAVTAAGRPYLLMPFALDVLACQLPGHDWPIERPLPDGTQVIALSERAATAGLLGAATLGRPSLAERVRHRARAVQAGCAIALGAPTTQPPVFDLSLGGPARRRALPVPDTILICDAPGPVAHDLRNEAEAGRWHYYLDTAGSIYCLRDERSTAAAAAEPGEEDLADRAIVIAVEGGPASAGPAQRRALSWLVRLLAAGLQIAPGRVRALAPARLQVAAGEGSLAHERGM